MDAAHTLKKTALFLSAALAFAAPSFAQPTLTVSSTSVTLTAATQEQQITLGSSDSNATALSYTISGGASWYHVTPASGNTPATLLVDLVGTNCALTAAGCTNVPFTIKNTTSGGAGDTQTVNVSFTTSGSGGSGTSTLTATPNPITLTYPTGTTSQTLTIGSTTATTTTFNASTTTSWLQINGASSISSVPVGSSISVTVNGAVAASLGAGTYTGTITLANAANGGDTTAVTVTLVVSGGGGTTGTLLPNPTSVVLSYPAGTSSTTLCVTSNSGTTQFVAYSNTNWLLINAQSSFGPAPVGSCLTLSVNASVAAGLGTNNYAGTLYLYNSNFSSDITTVPVTLSVNGGGGTISGVASPSSLSFAYAASAGQPPFQTVVVNGSGTINVTTSLTSGNWPTNTGISYSIVGSAPSTVLVAVSGGIATAGTYSGSVTISSSAGSQTIPVTLTVSSTPVLLSNPGDFGCVYIAGQANTCSGTLSISTSDGSTPNLSVTSSASWVTLSSSSAVSPANFQITINPASLSNGFNTGTITVTATNGLNAILTIPVAVLVSGNSGNVGLTLNTSSLSFTGSGTQQLVVSGQNIVFTASPRMTTNTGTNWLSISPSGSLTATPTGQTINVTVNAAGLSASTTYSGFIDLTVGGVTQSIPVTLTLSSTSGNITIANSSAAGMPPVDASHPLTFSAQANGTAAAAQVLHVASASGASGITFTVTPSPAGSWLQLSDGSGCTTANNVLTCTTTTDISVGASPGTMAAGTYNGYITFAPTGGTTIQVPVTFTVTPGASISATPSTLTFSYTAGSNPPTSQTINVSGNGGALSFAATATSTGNWLSVDPTAGVTAASGTVPLTVSLKNLDSLNANQTYTGTITVTGTAGAQGTSTITVTLNVTAPLPTLQKVTNAASYNSGSISAGEIITLFGTGLGPDTGVAVNQSLISNNKFPTTLGGVQVLVSGYAAPMIYASSGQVSAVVPYEINRPVYLQNVNVQVKYLGQTSNGISLSQAAAAPGIFTANASGSGPGAILNSDLSVNSSGNPAKAGDTVVLYVTGEGQTIPGGVSGAITPSTIPFTVPVQAPTVTINGLPAQVAFFAEAPGLISGVAQINVQIPQGTPSGPAPVVVSFGGVSSQMTANGTGAVTVAVR